MAEKALYAEIVKSGTWRYDNQVPHEVWIDRQNFDFYYEKNYEDSPEALNKDGEVFHEVFAHNGTVRSVVPATMSLAEAVSDAEGRLANHPLIWDDHRLQKLFAPYYSIHEDAHGKSAESVRFRTPVD